MILECINPTNGEILERLTEDDRRTIHEYFQCLRTGQKRWGMLSQAERAERLKTFGQLIDEQRKELARLLSMEVGKPLVQAREEIQRSVQFVEEYLAALSDADAEGVPRNGSSAHIEREPLGVIAHISTWSSPWQIGLHNLVPALMSGNAVLYKPSERAALNGQAIGRLLKEAGVPEDVFAVIIGDGYVGDFLLDERVAGVFFTGSFSTGRMISEKLATRLIPRQMELGGKDGVYICDDVDPEVAARVVTDGAFYNCGQNCFSVERVYVHETVYQRVIEATCERVASYKMGSPLKPDTFLGPMIGKEQLGALEYQVADALQKGAQVLAGGRAKGGKGYFFEPTILTEVDHRMLVMREETSGPAIALQRVGGDEEAASLLADSQYGMTASVFTASQKRATRLLGELDVGTVYWNDCGPRDPRPCMGRRHSGFGAEETDRFTRPKAWFMKPTIAEG